MVHRRLKVNHRSRERAWVRKDGNAVGLTSIIGSLYFSLSVHKPGQVGRSWVMEVLLKWSLRRRARCRLERATCECARACVCAAGARAV